MKYRLLSILLTASLLVSMPTTVSAQNDFDQTIRSLSVELAEKLTANGKQTVAVANFTDLQGNDTELGQFLAEEFSIALTEASNGFSVVDRSRINFLLKEEGLTVSGLVDPKAAVKLGKVAGIQTLLTGVITPYGDNVRLSVKVLDLEAATIVAASRGDIAKTQTIAELIDRPLGAQSSNGASSTDSEGSSSAMSSSTQTIDVFDFALQACREAGGVLTCDFLITSNKNQRINLSRSSRVIAPDGAESTSNRIRLGSKAGSYGVFTEMISGIPVQMGIDFTTPSSGLRSIAALEIHGRGESNFKLLFQNVDVSQ